MCIRPLFILMALLGLDLKLVQTPTFFPPCETNIAGKWRAVKRRKGKKIIKSLR